ncbi:hypothetical protein L083_5604 [Actinoplanes sp. N902-109]|nr:hypothetical protein L083_5604 [Actinoplanes sp. N902-109]
MLHDCAQWLLGDGTEFRNFSGRYCFAAVTVSAWALHRRSSF